MNITLTLALDERVVAQARKLARMQGTTLNGLIRQFIEQLAATEGNQAVLDELERLWKASPGKSSGRRLKREWAYEERLGRSPLR